MSAEKSPSSYYIVLGVLPSASVQEIRRAYRELSKLYHPDTTTLPPAVATEKFQQLNEAYATLSSPDLRASYDIRNGYSRVRVMRPDLPLDSPQANTPRPSTSAYLDPSDRPLSAGELFALFILGVTFAVCLLVVVMVGATRGEIALKFMGDEPTPAILRTVLPSSAASPSEPPSVAEPEPPASNEAAVTLGTPNPASPSTAVTQTSPPRDASPNVLEPPSQESPARKTSITAPPIVESPTGDRTLPPTLRFPLRT
ncbi:MAG: DnaJ domain-containing protein [Cyanobacteria bacterium J06638_22]